MTTPTGDEELAVLDNAVWAALTTRHDALATSHGHARRYPIDVSPFCAVESTDAAGWRDLAELVGPGGTAVLFRGVIGDVPDGWTVELSGGGRQMVLAPDAEPPGAASDGLAVDTVRELDERDVEAMLELVQLTQPGPFERNTVVLGDYVGVVEHGRLVAMAGARLRLPGYTEISAVCTHPDVRGRGLASQLTGLLVERIVARGEVPILHVTHDNPARRVYERLGFRVRRDVEFAVLRAPDR